jgi:NAD(P)-dependent dehydrogenase (short-subunit alcohol dehydrogenase family)
MRLEGRRALVTGASSGIGRAIAIRFGQEGARVAVTGRREDRVSETAAEVTAAGGEGISVVADHTKVDDNARALAETLAALGGLDVLVNCAGVIGNDSILDPKPDEWHRIIDINLHALYDLSWRAVPHLVEGTGACILNVSSIAGLRAFPPITAYCVSKAAVDMLTRCMALELAPKGVRVNAINPGVIESELHVAAKAVPDYSAFLERAKETHPIGRYGTPEEVAALAAFLASDEAGFVTGERHVIDGGRTLASPR